MVIPRSLTFLTAFHGGWDFGCCRIGLAASAMDFESGFPPDARAKPPGYRPGEAGGGAPGMKYRWSPPAPLGKGVGG